MSTEIAPNGKDVYRVIHLDAAISGVELNVN